MKYRALFFAVLTMLLSLFAGCAADTAPTQPQGTVENIFTASTSETAEPPTSGGDEPTSPVESTTKPPKGYVELGSLSMGFDDASQLNDMGPYLVYEGGEMHAGFSFRITGGIGNDGLGLMLVLDGKPQPYRTAETEEYSYLHTFYPPTASDGTISIELIFTPVTGKAGDNLLLQAFHLMDPDYDPAEKEIKGFRLTGGSTYSERQLICNAAPPECQRPEITERVAELSVQEADLTGSDISGWGSPRPCSQTPASSFWTSPLPGWIPGSGSGFAISSPNFRKTAS